MTVRSPVMLRSMPIVKQRRVQTPFGTTSCELASEWVSAEFSGWIVWLTCWQIKKRTTSTYSNAFQYSELKRVGISIHVYMIYNVRCWIRKKGYDCFALANSGKSLCMQCVCSQNKIQHFWILLLTFVYKKLRINNCRGYLTDVSANTEALFACSCSASCSKTLMDNVFF